MIRTLSVSRLSRAGTRTRSKRHLAFAFLAAFLAPLAAESSRTAEINAALRQEEKTHSEIMRTMHFLTDVYGPRLTGSPHAKAAAEWVVKTMGGWGFENGHLEPWEFGHPGWTNEHVTAHVVSPIKDQLTVEVLAWSPGTKGTVTAPAFQLAPPDRPTSGRTHGVFRQRANRDQGEDRSGRPRSYGAPTTRAQADAYRRGPSSLVLRSEPRSIASPRPGPVANAASADDARRSESAHRRVSPPERRRRAHQRRRTGTRPDRRLQQSDVRRLEQLSPRW